MVFTGKFVGIWLTISSCYGSISLNLVLIEGNGGFSTLYYNFGFHYQQRVIKKFSSPGCLYLKDGVV